MKWIDRVSSEKVLNKMKENRTLFDTVLKRKRNWIGHFIRGEEC